MRLALKLQADMFVYEQDLCKAQGTVEMTDRNAAPGDKLGHKHTGEEV